MTAPFQLGRRLRDCAPCGSQSRAQPARHLDRAGVVDPHHQPGRDPQDAIFPNINIPVISVAWTYTGLNPEEMEGRITTVFERALTPTVDNIRHIESTTINGVSITKVFLQPSASLDTANAQVTAISQTMLRGLPPGSQPPLIVNYSASSVPVLRLGLSGKGLTEQQLFDLGVNFLRIQLVTVPSAVIPFPFGGKQRQAMIYLRPDLRKEGPRVALVREGKAKLVPITIGRDYGTKVEVVSGLAAEDEVILDPADSLTDGAAVRVQPEALVRSAP